MCLNGEEIENLYSFIDIRVFSFKYFIKENIRVK